jgi:hypothetical protein
MAKVTVITDSAGEIVGTVNYTGEKGSPTLATVSAGPNTTMHEIDVADDVLHLSASELHLKLKGTVLSPVQVK